MNIRPLREDDLEPLHELYNHLVERMPFQARVGLAQFREDLRLTTSREKEGVFLPAGELHLVAENRGMLVGAGLAAYAQEKAKFAQPHTGMIRFLMTLPGEEEAAQGLIQELLAHIESFAPQHIRAMPYWYGPPFYNTGCGRLTGAWPWLGHRLLREKFQVLATYGTEIRMRRRVRSRPVPLPLPTGAEIRKVNAFSRSGPEFEHWYDLYLHGEKAGECHCLYGENYVRGTGKRLLYTNYLEVKEKFQGRGLGRIMLREALVAAYEEGTTEATLTTDATNFAALNLYRSEGYEPIDLLFEFELKPEDGALPIMAW